MAVQHGYGKIAGADALVFAYDTGDTRNSYRGEPTTNLATLDLSNTSKWYSEGGTKVLQSETLDGYPVYQFRSAGSTIYVSPIAFNQLTATSNDVTLSAYFKNIGTTAQTVNVFLANDFGTDSNGDPNNRSIPADGKWYRHSWTRYAANNTYNQVEFRTFSDTLLISKPQVEYKRHATPPVEGTRSATEGLLDLTGTNDITVANVSFDSNAQMVFDGTDDLIGYIYVGISDYSEPFTMECVFMVDPAATWDNGYRSNIFGIAGSYAGMYGLNKHGGDSVGLYIRDASGGSGCDVGGLSKGVYYHLVGTWDGTNDIRIYLNGSLSNTTTSAKSGAPDTTSIWVGGTRAYSGAGGQAYHGEIPVAKYYNRVLTASEVANNYNHYKGRFNI